jgi:seryl-tRNA synthetase
MGRPCVTSSLDRLDAVADVLAAKIQTDEKEAESLMGEVESLLRRVSEVRKRIALNKKSQEDNNRRVEEEVQHLVENLPPDQEDSVLLEAASLSVDLGPLDPFSWPPAEPVR